MKPWVKSWRPRQGSEFEVRVSAPSKNFFAGILRHFDESGRMVLPKSKHLHNAFGMAHGWDSRERRPLEKRFAELIDHGCLEATQDEQGFWTLHASNFSRWNEDPKTAKARSKKPPAASRVSAGCAPTAHRETPDCATSAIRDAAKPPESLGPKIQEREREEEREEENTQRAREDSHHVRWLVFEQTWREHHGGSGLGLCTPGVVRDIGRMRENIRDPESWRLECVAFAACIEDPGNLRSVWAVFRGEAGNWKRKRESQINRANSGAAPVTPAEDRGPPTDMSTAFDHLLGDRSVA